jgi:cell division protein FtsB
MSFRTTAKSVVEAQKQLEDLKRENEALKKDLRYKSSDKFAEEEIRNKLGMAKPGETVVILPKGDSNLQLTANNQPPVDIPNWQKWWNLFFRT